MIKSSRSLWIKPKKTASSIVGVVRLWGTSFTIISTLDLTANSSILAVIYGETRRLAQKIGDVEAGYVPEEVTVLGRKDKNPLKLQ